MVAIIIAIDSFQMEARQNLSMTWVSADIRRHRFGALTLWFRDPKFIQIKPTMVYLLFAAILFGGLLRGKALLQYLLQHAFDGVSDLGWKKLIAQLGLFLHRNGCNQRSYPPDI